MATNLDDLNSTTGTNDRTIDPFDAPIPGQSLTGEPGTLPWEKPPKFLTPTDAINFFIMRLNEDKIFNDTLSLIYGGVTIESITKVLTFNAFSEGLITPDIAEIINPYLFLYLLSMAKRAGIKPRLLNNPTKEINPVELLNDLRPEDAKQLLEASQDQEGSRKIMDSFMAMHDQPKVDNMSTEAGDLSYQNTREPTPIEEPIDEEVVAEGLADKKHQ